MPDRAAESRYSPMRVLTVGVVVVSLAAGALGVLLTLKPELKPCLGDPDASFVAAPVFPRSSHVSYLIRGGTSRPDALDVGEKAGGWWLSATG